MRIIKFTKSFNNNYLRTIFFVTACVTTSVVINILLYNKMEYYILSLVSIVGGLISGLITFLLINSLNSTTRNIPLMHVTYSGYFIKHISNCPILLSKKIKVVYKMNEFSLQDYDGETPTNHYIDIKYKFEAIPSFNYSFTNNIGFRYSVIYKPLYFDVVVHNKKATKTYNLDYFEAVYFADPKKQLISNHTEFVTVSLNEVLRGMMLSDYDGHDDTPQLSLDKKSKKTTAK